MKAKNIKKVVIILLMLQTIVLGISLFTIEKEQQSIIEDVRNDIKKAKIEVIQRYIGIAIVTTTAGLFLYKRQKKKEQNDIS